MNFKNVKSHNTTKIILFSFVFVITFLSISCKNFLNGSSLKEDIDAFITYEKAPFAIVNITSVGIETAALIPAAGSYEDKYKAGDSFEIKFEAQTGYSFSHWQVTPEGAASFDEKNSPSTTVTINSADKPITIRPYALPRPKVVSATPAYDSNGVYRDRTIIVMFNKEMDEKSIYWTESELKEMKIPLENALKVDDSQFYYAYKDSGKSDLYTYKNIEITKYNDSSVNLLKYYGIPKFDITNKKILRIPASNEFLPPSATDILVTLKKDFFYKTDDSDAVTLSDDYDWPYYTNGNFDDKAPVFVENDENNGFTVTIADDPEEGEEDQKNYKTENTAAKLDPNEFSRSHLDVYKSLNLKNKKLWVRGSFTDVGSGPGSLKWEVYKVNSDLYPCTTEEEQQLVQAGQIKNLTVIGFNASVNPVYDQGSNFDKGGELVEINNLEKEGLYRIDFVAWDKNERGAKKSYYFVHDLETKSLFTENLISNSRPSFDKETVSWSEPSNPDFDHAIVECWLNGSKVGETFEDSEKSKSTNFTNLSNHTKYEYRFYSVDIYGNKSEDYVVWKDNKGPSALIDRSKVINSRSSAANESVTWDKPTGSIGDYDHVYIEQYDGSTLKKTYEQNSPTLTASFTGLTNQKKYKYRFYSVDYAGNRSTNYTEWQDDTGPAPVTGLYSDAGQYRVSLHFTTPSTEDFDHIEVYRNSSTTKETLFADKARKTLASPTAKSTKYMVRPDSYAGSSDTWKVYAVDFAGNKSAVSQITEGYAKPGMIVYQTTEKGEPIVSSNWYGNFYCVGVLYTVDDYINVARTASRKGNYVWDITEYLDIFIWGKNDWPQYDDTKQHDDGKRDYEMIVSKYREQCVDYRDSRNPYNQTVWQYLEQTRNYNNKLTWWLPAIDDYKTIIKYMDDIDAGINFIRSNGGSVDFVKNQWYASSSVGNGHDSHRACYYQLRNNSFANKSHGYTDDTWKDLPGHSMWHFMTEVNLD